MAHSWGCAAPITLWWSQSSAGIWQVYQTPIALREGPPEAVVGARAGTAIDALHDAQVVAAILRVTGATPSLDPIETPLHPQTQWPRPPPVDGKHRVLTVEQSNTSVVIGDKALVKFFRILVPGINPDVEVHAALAAMGSAGVAEILGWINGGWPDPSGQAVHGHLAMISEFFPDAVDGWALAGHHSRQALEFAPEAESLGLATALVHDELAAAFPTVSLGRAEVDELADRLQRRLRIAGEVVAESAALLPRLHERIERIREIRR